MWEWLWNSHIAVSGRWKNFEEHKRRKRKLKMYNFLDNVYFYKNEQALTAEEKHKNTSFGLKQ